MTVWLEHPVGATASELCLSSGSELAAALRRRELSSRELLGHYLQRVERLNRRINAVVALDAQRALMEANAADKATAKGESLGPLHGLPITIKTRSRRPD